MTVAELQALVFKLQSQLNQLELTNKGANKALEFRLEAVLQANLDTFWLLICAILVFLMQAGFMCLESGLSRAKSSINVALKNVTDFGISVATFWAFGFALMYGTSISGLFGSKFFFYYKSCRISVVLCIPSNVCCNSCNNRSGALLKD